MDTKEIEKLKYPIGTFQNPKHISSEHINTWIAAIEQFPNAVESITKDLNPEQLQWQYRPDGWTIKQVVHHCADSHMNSIIRFKLALTEDAPTIKPYEENLWANLIDGNDDNLENSLCLLKGLHAKLGKLLRNISKTELSREFIHPEHGKRFRLDETIGTYAWHSNHHLAHIKQALKYKGKF
ncbi:YfiT family bacillithiol transferase [Psychroserpens sp. SPM9]|uniref:YfiT family bacillithiol transferase n=1 Tax=Psychroserpens sp. SPM9 TaxID=2975598 RepID=UPI0021A92CED|nr:putative metal-dependent hydrolase [Psychroserpens sp. SPM9]MDG5493112.1 putative metal-dependent hydrolase [Psychroserpens sp. SPM9]